MQANLKKIFLLLVLLAGIGCSVVLFMSEEYVIAAFCLLIAIIMAILLYRNISLNRSPESLYKGTVSNILKTYDAILVEVENLPDISEKKLIQTISFKDMLNAEYEFRKPIYYIHNDYAYDFILFNKDDAYVYTVKIGNDKMSIVENFLSEKIREKSNSNSDLDMLDSLENTTIIKLNEDKEYLVSPLRKEESKQDISSNNIDSVNTVSTINNDSSHIEGTPVIDSNQEVLNIQNDIEQSVSSENTLNNQVDVPNISEEVVMDTQTVENNVNNQEVTDIQSDIEQPILGENTLDNQVDVPSLSEKNVMDTQIVEDNVNNQEVSNCNADVNINE